MKRLFLVLLLLALGGCGAGASPTATPTAFTPGLLSSPVPTVPAPPDSVGLTLPPAYSATRVAEGLRGPTQMILGPDERVWVAQLAGGENEGEGQLVALALEGGEREVLLDNLFKPTGIALLGDALWIASGNDLLRAPLTASGVGEPETVLAELPFNGRSNGTLTVTPDGALLFETSGRRRGNEASEGSATLWKLDPAAPTDPVPLASGLKGAYAHTFDGTGRLWVTEIGDDPVNGAPPPDELNLFQEGADFGWPACFGFQQPALNFGGSEALCAATRAPVVLFPPQSTPVSVVPSPWEPQVLLVALWGPTEPMVARVAINPEGDNATGEVTPFIEGMEHPQSLLSLPDGSLLASDFGTGTLYRITRP